MLDTHTKEKLKSLLNNEEKTALFAEKFFEMINTDDTAMEDIGEYMIRTLLDDDVNGLLISVCGWSAESILEFIA